MGLRFFLRANGLALIVALAFFAVPDVGAQTYPIKPVRLVVAFGAGGSVDLLARIVGQKLGEAWGQAVIVDNRAGAGGNIATDAVAKAPADGYSLLFHSPAIALNAILYKNLPFNTVKDLAPIMLVASTNGVLVVPSSLPVQSIREVIALAKAQPGRLNFASTGNGSSGHLQMELFKSLTGIDIVHVPYKNISQVYTDVISGLISMSMNTLPGMLPHIKSGKLRALAVTGSTRSDILPDLPTMQEAGVPAYEAVTWYGAFTTAGTSAQIIAKINADMQRVLALPEVRQRFASSGLDPQGGAPEYFAKYFQEEIVKWDRVVKSIGMQLE